jgi:alpha-D-ribose 1-methylphosphonate 5-triphosphate synthase subunit PhnG
MGFSYALGRDGRKARLAAVIDGLLQDEGEAGPLRHGVTELAARQQAARELASRKAAATKVDFFTLVRGA